MAPLIPSGPDGPSSRDRTSGLLGIVLAAAAVAVWFAVSAGAQPKAGEYEVKAAYLLNFARFVEWPLDALGPSSPLTIAVVGDDPFGGTLDKALTNRAANGHPIRHRRLRWDDDLTHYQIIFISASEEAHLPQILDGLGPHSVLTVSDIDRFSLRGGVIEFRMVGNRVRFDINRTSALAAQLNISSKLLSVARTVQNGSVQR